VASSTVVSFGLPSASYGAPFLLAAAYSETFCPQTNWKRYGNKRAGALILGSTGGHISGAVEGHRESAERGCLRLGLAGVSGIDLLYCLGREVRA
jgi:hypothetical protein